MLHECIHQHIYEFDKNESKRVYDEGKKFIDKLKEMKKSPSLYMIVPRIIAVIQHAGKFMEIAEYVKNKFKIVVISDSDGYCSDEDLEKSKVDFLEMIGFESPNIDEEQSTKGGTSDDRMDYLKSIGPLIQKDKNGNYQMVVV